MGKLIFENPFIPQLEIRRYPYRDGDLLQGWDSADELILEHASALDLSSVKILIVQDQFGALSSALQNFHPRAYTDSFVSFRSTELNGQRSVVPENDLSAFSEKFDLVLVRIPKNMSFFEDILCHLTGLLNPGAKVICASMVKYLTATSFQLLERLIGKTTTGLAKKKARLVFAEFTGPRVPSPYPKEISIENFDRAFVNHSNLFSREKLDIGTRFFLEHLPGGDYSRILDLGCGNGIVGIKAKLLNPQAQLIFSDESNMALMSARSNYSRYFQEPATYLWTNCYESQLPESLDLVLCNPPFHQGHTIGDFIARQMFQDSHRALRKGGLLRVIGNSHLGYRQEVRGIFGNSTLCKTNEKFVIIDAIK
ncbi:MAG TPA: methyltransferase [Bacteriovoracaceae bacterium]|nr:methyltransferase [Bacteriovoracaceae bacterium]